MANGVQDVALAFEPKEGNELTKPPRKPSEPIFERGIIEHVLVTGSAMGGLAFITFYYLNQLGVDIQHARNMTLMLMVLFGNIHVLSSRSENSSLFTMPFFSNPFLILAVPIAQLFHIGAMYTPGLNQLLQIQPITVTQWTGLLFVAVVLLFVEEGHKYFLRKRT
ncbi:MAG: cation-translocating P-type ATPase C-terminal domain-containing protein [Psychromonas sp.]